MARAVEILTAQMSWKEILHYAGVTSQVSTNTLKLRLKLDGRLYKLQHRCLTIKISSSRSNSETRVWRLGLVEVPLLFT